MDDLVKRLRAVQWSVTGEPCANGNVDETCAHEAAAALEAKEAEIAALRGALAELLAELPPIGMPEDIGSVHTFVTIGTIGKARAALQRKD